MPILYQAIDDADVDGTVFPDGIIVVQSTSEEILRQQLTALGHTEGNYTLANQRIRTVDTEDTVNWDRRCVPGWYRVGDGVHRRIPLTADQQAIADRKAALLGYCQFRETQSEQLDLLSHLASEEKRRAGHQWLLYGLIMLYLVDQNRLTDLMGSNSGNLVDFSVNANVIALALAMATGAANITSAAEFYDDPAENNAPTFPVSWRDLTDATFPALTLMNARRTRNRVAFSGDLPTVTELNAWIISLSME